MSNHPLPTITNIQPPLLTASPDGLDWADVCDVLVIGWGAAGACSALEARAAGADVIVADRFTGGGASAKSGGVVYAGGGTRHQAAAGFTDSPEAMFDYLRHEVQGVVSDDTLLDFCRNSVANLAWLESKGAPYTHSVPPGGKTSYPPDGYYLYYSGNELVPSHGGVHPPAPRGHRTVGKGHGGAVLYAHLKAACLHEGVRPMIQSAARRLVVDQRTGAVIGAELWSLPPGSAAARDHARMAGRAERLQNLVPRHCNRLRRKLTRLEREYAEPRLVRARNGVVLSTGGFIFNGALLKDHAPKYRRNFKIGATGCDGSGLRLGQSVGGVAGRLDRVSAWRFINPPLCWPKGIVVNRRGERFCNEEVYGATLGQPIMEDQDGRAWLVLDAPLRRQAIRQVLGGGYWWFQSVPALALMTLGVRKGKTLEALAKATGMDAAALRASVEAYTGAIRSRSPDPFGKSESSRRELSQAPFYACDISVTSGMFPLGALTLGGLTLRERDGAVLSSSGAPVPGLYAAGRTAVGIPSHLYVSGLSLADCVYSGRRAGRSAAAPLPGAPAADAIEAGASASVLP